MQAPNYPLPRSIPAASSLTTSRVAAGPDVRRAEARAAFHYLPRMISLAAAVILICSQALPAQQQPDQPKPSGLTDASQDAEVKTVPFGIALPDSPGAADLLKRARQEEKQKHWDNAIELYQKALTDFPNRVVPVQDKTGSTLYAGIASVVQDRLTAWPDEGLKACASQLSQAADDLLRGIQSDNVAGLANLFWTYPATDAGRTAGVRLVDIYLENGQFQQAAWLGTRILSLPGSSDAERAMLLYRTAMAHHFAGHDIEAHQLLDQLKNGPADQIGSIAGKDVPLVESLSALLAAPPPAPTTRPSDADTYPSFGGSGSRGEISSSAAKFGGEQKSVQLAPPSYPGCSGQQLASFQAADKSASGGYDSASTIMPVVDDGTLFFQDGRSLYAIDPATACPPPNWLSTYGGDKNGRYQIDVFGRARFDLTTVTVSPAAVLAVMGQPDPMAAINNAQRNITPTPAASTVRLVCLDRNTGRQRWTRTPADLPELAKTLNTAEYDGTPLIIPAQYTGRANTAAPEDSVLITARSGRQNQFDDCYVVCLSLRTGQYRWSTYLGGATHGPQSQNAHSQMALAEGRIFVMTNLGTVAALDPSDGRVIWLNSYRRESLESPEHQFLAGGQRSQLSAGLMGSRSWEVNPVFVTDGNVFVLPNDAIHALVYNADTGSEIARLPISRWDNANLLLGVRKGLLLLNSTRKVFAVDWQKFMAGDHPDDVTPWSTDISFIDHSTTCGRGFVTADSIFIPTTNRLVRVAQGRAKATYPPLGSFARAQGPGNLLATRNAIVVASQMRIDIYTNSLSAPLK